MNIDNNISLSTSPQLQPARKLRKTASLALRQRLLCGRKRPNNTGKERDSETGLYYYGARYLDPKASRWLSGDPAVGEYIPVAPVSDEARKRNGNLPGMGGVFNYVNLHVYHYGGNNPVRYVDPDGKLIKVQIHKAFGINGFYHASMKIALDTPELREVFQNDEKFIEHGLTDSNGNLYITIGGEAKGGLLQGKINRESDVRETNKIDSYLMIGVDEVVAVGRILDAFEAYNDDLKYSLFPELGEGYNSNSYISGILDYAELPRYDLYQERSSTRIANMPGWDKPIPIPRADVE